MVDADHKDDTGGFVDANQYAIVTPAGAAIVPEFVGEWLAEPGRIVSTGPVMNSMIADAILAGSRYCGPNMLTLRPLRPGTGTCTLGRPEKTTPASA